MYKSRECIIKLLYNIHSYACILVTISCMNIPRSLVHENQFFESFEMFVEYVRILNSKCGGKYITNKPRISLNRTKYQLQIVIKIKYFDVFSKLLEFFLLINKLFYFLLRNYRLFIASTLIFVYFDRK